MLETLWCLDAPEAAEIRTMIERAPENRLLALPAILKKGQKRQDDFLTKMVKHDPQFAEKLRGFLRTTVTGFQEGVEKQEEQDLDSLSQKLDES